jgi:hypothetical protein
MPAYYTDYNLVGYYRPYGFPARVMSAYDDLISAIYDKTAFFHELS